MDFLLTLGPWAAVVIFFLRIVDVSLTTIRTISLVHGRIVLAVTLGFFEVLIWISVVSQVLVAVRENPIVLVAYAAGFAVGNGVGILLERKIAIGTVVVRMISQQEVSKVAQAIRALGQGVTCFHGEGMSGPVDLLYITCPRRAAQQIVETALAVDPQIFYVTEIATGLNRKLSTLPHMEKKR